MRTNLEEDYSGNTKHFEVGISNDSVLEWLVIATAIAMVLIIPKPNHWKSKKMAAILFGFPMVLYKMATILFKTECHWKNKHHWKTEQRATIGIPDMFRIPAW